MQTETAADLLDAVGVEWKQRADLCRDSRPAYEIGGDNTAYFAATDGITYTGPALGTPELDALLLVAGVEKLREASKDGLFAILSKLPDHEFHNAALTLLVSSHPGHALARAIREVQS